MHAQTGKGRLVRNTARALCFATCHMQDTCMWFKELLLYNITIGQVLIARF